MKHWDKFKLAAGILLVFFIVLVTNVIDKENFNKLSYSVTTIYEDRVVAADLIFEISRIVQQLEVELLTDSTLTTANAATFTAIDALTDRYGQTKLTRREAGLLSQLKRDINTLKNLTPAEGKPAMIDAIHNIDEDLYNLSKIQVEEARRQVTISNQAIDNIALFTRWEIIFLIVIAVIVQIIIFYNPD